MLQQSITNWLDQNGHLVDSPKNDLLKTPSSNTGLNSQSSESTDFSPVERDFADSSRFGDRQDSPQDLSQFYEPWIDYYQATARVSYHTLQQLVKYYSELVKEDFVPYPGRGRYIGNRQYSHSLQSPLGAQIYWVEDERNELFGITEYLQTSTNISIDDSGELSNDATISATTWVYVHLSIPGKPLNIIGVEKQLDLLYELTEEYGFKVTRIDTKVRDYSKRFNISDLTAIASKGDYSGAREYSTHSRRHLNDGVQSTDDISQLDPTKCSGETVYFGTPSSDKRITFYNSKYVHDVDAIDIETRWRNDRAKACLASILYSQEGDRLPTHEAVRVIHRIVSGSINFIHRSRDKNIKRHKMYDFWRDFTSASGGVLKISLPKRLPSGYRMVEWLSRQAACTFFMLSKLIGRSAFVNFIDNLIQRGGERLSQAQQAYMNICMQSKDDLKKQMSAKGFLSS